MLPSAQIRKQKAQERREMIRKLAEIDIQTGGAKERDKLLSIGDRRIKRKMEQELKMQKFQEEVKAARNKPESNETPPQKCQVRQEAEARAQEKENKGSIVR